MLFDTLELSKALQASFALEPAETLVHALGRAAGEQVATKADVAEVKGEIAELRGEIAAVRSEHRAEIAASEARLTSQSSLLRADAKVFAH